MLTNQNIYFLYQKKCIFITTKITITITITVIMIIVITMLIMTNYEMKFRNGKATEDPLYSKKEKDQ